MGAVQRLCWRWAQTRDPRRDRPKNLSKFQCDLTLLAPPKQYEFAKSISSKRWSSSNPAGREFPHVQGTLWILLL